MAAIVLTHQSALEYWQSALRFNPTKEVTYAKNLIRAVPKPCYFKAPFSCGLKDPLHVLVAEEKLRRQSNECVSHVWRHSLPRGSVADSGRGFYVLSPELCFIVMARSLSFIKLIKLGFSLCGSYVSSNETIYSCQPLFSTGRLKDCIDKNRGVEGARKAEKALKYVLDNSASPKETELTMLLCLPPHYGGYGFRQPILNYQVNKRNKWGTTLANHFKCDLAWPEARVALEYDSKEFHEGSDRLSRDSIRRTELINLGYFVMTASLSQVETTLGTKNLATALAKQMNRRLRLPEPRFSDVHAKLRKELF